MRKHTRISPALLKKPVCLLAFGFGSGLVPVAPGTAGTVVGVLFYWALSPLPLLPYLGVVVGLSLVGIWLCGAAARVLKVHDHPGIVWDEIVGYLITMAAVPMDWVWVGIGFVVFRFFDIVKPWPIRYVDRQINGGVGIMLDDVLAGVFGALVMQLLLRVL